MVTCTHSDAFLVKQRADLRHWDAIEHETHYRHTVLGIADERQTGNLSELFAGILRQLVLMVLDVADAEMAYVVEGSPQSDGISHIGCTSLEAGRRYVVFRAFDGHVLDHVASTLPRLHLVQEFLTAIDHADAVGSVDLMTAEYEEIGTELLHIHRRMGDALSTIDEHRDVVRVGDVDDAPHIVDGAEGVVHMPHADEPCARCDESLELREYQVTVFIRRDSLQSTTLLLTDTLPGDNVCMVVELRDDDFVAWCQELPSVGLCHEVDALGGTTHEDDFLTGGSIDEPLHLLSGFFVGIRRTGCKGMGTTMDVTIIVLIIIRYLVDDLNRLLRGGTVVEPHKVVAVHFLMQHGEVLLDLLRVQRVGLLIVEVAQFLRLRDADAEAVVFGDYRPHPYPLPLRGGEWLRTPASKA